MRLRILELLRSEGELSVGELVRQLRLSRPQVSNHLACLRWCGFTVSRREGRTIYNGIADARVEAMLDLADSLLADNAEHRWIRDALAPAVRAAPEPVERAPEAAAILRNRCGPERTARLSGGERRLYRWVIERFALATPPTGPQLAVQAEALALDPSAALATLAREDLVHADDDGAVTVAYPFSARARGHEVAVEGRVVQAMCAIDALGISALLDQPIEVRSHDPLSGREIRVHATPDGVTDCQPQPAVVLAASSCCEGPSYCGCCDVLNFFESSENARRYLREHPEVAGMPISIREAAAGGRAIFGTILLAAAGDVIEYD